VTDASEQGVPAPAASLLEGVKRLAEAERVAVGHLVRMALADTIARLDAEALCRAREGRSAPAAAWRALERM
jgi:hypothetical protein